MASNEALQFAPKFRRYGAYGLSIHSELPLPLPELPGQMQPALLDIEIRASAHSLASAIPETIRVQRSLLSPFDFAHFPDGSSYVRWDDVGDILISNDGRRIVCHPFAQTASESFNVYLLGQALSFALVKNGFEPLHATAVVIGDQAVAFLGDCGLGKSTLAGAFLQAGYPLLTDDLLLLQSTGSQVLAYPGPPRIKLFADTARMLLGASTGGVHMNPNTRKLIIPLKQTQVGAHAVPLSAVYVLSTPGEVAGGVRIASLTKREAFVVFLAAAFNYVIDDPDRLRRQFEAARELSNAITLRSLSYPRSVECLYSVRESILADLSANSELPACKA